MVWGAAFLTCPLNEQWGEYCAGSQAAWVLVLTLKWIAVGQSLSVCLSLLPSVEWGWGKGCGSQDAAYQYCLKTKQKADSEILIQ